MLRRVRGEKFDCDELRYKQPRTNQHGGKSVYITFANSERVVLQTPRMHVPFGVSVFEDGLAKKYTLDVSFRGMDKDDKNAAMTRFYRNLCKFDEKLIQDGVDNGFLWLRKKGLTRETVETAMYTKQIKFSRNSQTGDVDERYPPRLKVKMYTNGENFSFEAFRGDTKEKLDVTTENVDKLLASGSQVQLLLQLTGIWFASGKYGVSWKAMQMKIFQPQTLDTYAFLPDSDDEDKEEGEDIGNLTFDDSPEVPVPIGTPNESTANAPEEKSSE